MSWALESVGASMPTHCAPMCGVMVTSVMAPRKKAQAGREAALRRIGEAPVIQNIGVLADAFFFPQVMHGVERRGKKQQACQHQKQHAQSVRGQQAARRGLLRARP